MYRQSGSLLSACFFRPFRSDFESSAISLHRLPCHSTDSYHKALPPETYAPSLYIGRNQYLLRYLPSSPSRNTHSQRYNVPNRISQWRGRSVVLTRLGTPGEIGPLTLVKLWVTSVIAASWPAGQVRSPQTQGSQTPNTGKETQRQLTRNSFCGFRVGIR